MIITANNKANRPPYAVRIGSQVWQQKNYDEAVTPEGNVIANVTDNATWSESRNLYDAAYAAHSGTTAEKEYAGLLAAAMWCNYDNDAALGRVYGKIYNWYAAKLLDLDMASTGFGWRVPTDAQFTTLVTTLGGESVAGGKMKATGFDYWDSPNTGATNESGFTALGGGVRVGNGNYVELKTAARYTTSDQQLDILYQYFRFNHDSNSITNVNVVFNTGGYLRLIKV